MLKFFNDSTNNGKLYINDEFKDRIVKVSECAKYKELVNNESVIKDLKKYNFPIIMKIIGFHLKKANYMVNGKYCIPSYEDFYKIDLNKIYDIQCLLKNKIRLQY